jgi:general secretion pathway protein E
LDQRLIRLLCPRCADTHPDTGSPRSRGCPDCAFTGFKGRTGLFRTLTIDDAIRDAIRNMDYNAVKNLAARQCKGRLLNAANALLNAGRTTEDEINRVLRGDEMA